MGGFIVTPAWTGNPLSISRHPGLSNFYVSPRSKIQLDYKPTFTGRSSPVLIPVVSSLAAPYAYDTIYYTYLQSLLTLPK
jgi:hypothetical protein